ncbi:MAG TPA: DUF4147 domain-containing protein [Candidatus Cloacimonetes bacterium]|nr:DUF4147 domain-containing protein [Candidatus Cloacimonadota bacterium]HEX37988.1 DUF4147 domain-containing protein [Candidatus Cloacimonadota bacterium]
MRSNSPFHILDELFKSGLRGADPARLIQKILKLEKNNLVVQKDDDYILYNLEKFDEIVVIGAGKASERMAEGLYDVLGTYITEGLVVTKSRRFEMIGSIRIMEAGHPTPDERSVKGGIALQNIAHQSNERTLIISLISGGASSLVEVPRIENIEEEEIKLSLNDLITITQLLLHSGASIDEINCVRKHLSMIKGGYLSAWMYPATALNFILSDVKDDRIDIIGSGLTTYDESMFLDINKIIRKYGLEEKIPNIIKKLVQLGIDATIFETPKSKELVFDRTENVVIGNNQTAIDSIIAIARELDFNTKQENTWVKGESREVGRRIFQQALRLSTDAKIQKPLCVISGGETTVTVKGDGFGGRNQELALGFLEEMKKCRVKCSNIFLLSASTDGDDGPTDAAGALASYEVLEKSKHFGLSIEDYLARNDSYTFFDKCGYLYKTGHTRTNVCDVQILLII